MRKKSFKAFHSSSVKDFTQNGEALSRMLKKDSNGSSEGWKDFPFKLMHSQSSKQSNSFSDIRQESIFTRSNSPQHAVVRGQFSFTTSTTSEDYVRRKWVILTRSWGSKMFRRERERRWTIKPSIIIVSKQSFIVASFQPPNHLPRAIKLHRTMSKMKASGVVSSLLMPHYRRHHRWPAGWSTLSGIWHTQSERS